jgi:hypothetical protein
MSDTATTTSGNIYVQPADNTGALVKEAEYELATRVHHATNEIKDKATTDTYMLDAGAQRRADINESSNQRRADANILANSLSYQNLTAQANQFAATETLAASLGLQNLTQQANENARNGTNLATNNSFTAAAQADRVAQAAVIAGTLQAKNTADDANRIATDQRTEQHWFRQEARDAAAANVIAGYVTRDLIRTEADATRALINGQYSDSLRDKLNLQHQELVELKYENRRNERDFYNSNFNNLQAAVSSNINALSSQIQQVHAVAAQGLTNFGTMGANTQSASNQTA